MSESTLNGWKMSEKMSIKWRLLHTRAVGDANRLSANGVGGNVDCWARAFWPARRAMEMRERATGDIVVKKSQRAELKKQKMRCDDNL